MAAESQRVPNGLSLGRSLCDERCCERAPFELQPQAAFERVELEIGRILRHETERRLDAME